MLKILLQFVTRTPARTEGEEDTSLNFTILNSEEYIISSNRRRDALLASEAEKKELREDKSDDEEEDEEDDEDDFAFSKEAKRADKAAEVFVYQIGSLPQDFIDKNLEIIGIAPSHTSTLIMEILYSIRKTVSHSAFTFHR